MFGGDDVVVVVRSRDETGPGFRSAENHGHRFRSAMGAIARGAAFGLAGVGVAATGMGIKFVKAAEDSIKVSRQTQAVIKSTGGVAKVSAKDVEALAQALSRKTGIDDEAIASGENMLLTFTNVRNEVGKGNDIFDQATRAALDMAVATGKDATQANLQLGKALNDPIRGITALSRVGVQFTQQQRDQIKAMVEAGDIMGAQKIILAEVTKEFGGSAEAQATASDKMSVAWGNAQEALGTALLPLVEKFSDWLINTGTPAIENYLVPAIENGLVPALEGIGSILSDTVMPALRGLSDWISDEAVPRISNLAAKIEEKLGGTMDDSTRRQEGFRGTFDSVWSAIQEKFWSVIDFMRDAWSGIEETIQVGLGIIQDKFWKVMNGLREVFDTTASALRKAWEQVRAKAGQVADWISEKWNTAMGYIANAMGYVREALKPFAKVAAAVFGAVAGYIGWVIDKLAAVGGWVADLIGRFTALADLVSGLTHGTIDVKHAAKGKAAGGPTGAAGGGPRTAPFVAGELGPELIGDVPPGTMVHPAANTAQMLSDGGAGTTVVNLYVQGSLVTERDLVGMVTQALRDKGLVPA